MAEDKEETKGKESAKALKEKRTERLKALQAQISKKHGSDELILIGNEVKQMVTNSSGSSSLDKALGGGYAQGRVIEIYGQEASGKTTLTLHAIAEQQKAGKTCAFIDVEQALDASYASRIGVKMDELLIVQPDFGEQAGQIAQDLAESGEVDCIVIDSVAAMVPKKEIEGELEDHNMGLQARMMSKLCRTLTPVAARNKVTIFFINQMRMKIGVMFGNPNTTTGGNALKFYASQRIQMMSGQKVFHKTTSELIGGTLKCKIVKNKIASPGNVVEVPIVTGKGIDAVADTLELSKQVFKEVKDASGPFRFAGGHHWFYGVKQDSEGKYSGMTLDDGSELKDGKLAGSGSATVDLLRENPKMYAALRKLTMKTLADQRAAALL